MAQVSVTTTGVKDLLSILGGMDKSAKKVLRVAMEAATQPAFDRTQVIVPLKTGRLKRSGRISIRAGAQQLTARILYGAEFAPHAYVQHEGITFKHKGNGQAKYVESVVANYPFLEHLAKHIDLAALVKG